VFLAGDAAHLMPPFLGQGLCAGLRDARALTWRLLLVQRGLADQSLLDTYGSERREHVRVIIDEAVAIGRVICETDPDRAAARDAGMRMELADPSAVTVEPPHPQLGTPSVTVFSDGAEGRLAPQGHVEVAGRVGLYDDVFGPGWQLIGWEHDPAQLMDEDVLHWFRSLGGTVAAVGPDGPVRDVDGAYRRWFEQHGCTVVLARPDFYVFGAGAKADAPRLLTDLRAQLEPTHSPRQGLLTP
jgi:3-(3-hydroxy-phenyl)propionate hydroxylase